MAGSEAERFFLRTQLASCPLAGWYARLTGDEKTAAQYRQVVKKMLARLELHPSKSETTASGGALLGAALDSPGDRPGWEQLPLL